MSQPNKIRFSLTEAQVNALEIHYINIYRQILNYVDGDFNLNPFGDSNWPMLNQHLVEMMMLEDKDDFSLLVERILRNMDQLDINNPFVAASYAEAGKTDTKPFNDMLDRITAPASRNAFGLIHFHSGFLGLGDHFSTLWALRLITLARKTKEYEAIVCKALEALSLDVEYVLRKSPDFVGFVLYCCLTVFPENNRELASRCLTYLLNEQQEDGWWYRTDPSFSRGKDPRSNGFVAYDLLLAAPQYPEVMPAVERWLKAAFDLSEENPQSLPEIFSTSQQRFHPDVWSQGWVRAIIAAGMYIRMRKPGFKISKDIILTYVQTNNEAKQYRQFYATVQPFLPPTEELYRFQHKLREFWKDADYDKSVFIMRRMGDDILSAAMLQAILSELSKHGLKGRYVGDQAADYFPSLSENNTLYMRGCKHGIAILERLQTEGRTQDIVNPNILVEIGFMQGKGARILILFDEDTMTIRPTFDDSGSLHGHQLPPVISGTIYKPFNSSSSQLSELKHEVGRWAEAIVGTEDKEEKEEQNG